MGFKENLKKLRKSRDMTQAELASVLDVDRSAVAQWEAGTAYPRMEKAVEMVQYFHISLDDLVTDAKPSDGLRADERELLGIYRSMDDSARQMALCALRGMAASRGDEGHVEEDIA